MSRASANGNGKANGKPRLCGEFGGITAQGNPCKHPTPHHGLCYSHNGSPEPKGRPTLYDQARADAICAALDDGLSLGSAAGEGGVHYVTMNEWRKNFPEFDERVTRALAKGRGYLERKVARSDDWRASIALLERRYPAEFSLKHQLELSGTIGVVSVEDALRELRVDR